MGGPVGGSPSDAVYPAASDTVWGVLTSMVIKACFCRWEYSAAKTEGKRNILLLDLDQSH